MMGDDTKRVVIRIKRHIPIYPHLAPAVGEIVVADRLNDPYSSRYFYGWARLHREQSREAARRSYYRRKQKK